MSIFNIVVLIFLVGAGIPNAIIDYKHRKKNGYTDGNAWAYYSKLSKEGCWEGKFICGQDI